MTVNGPDGSRDTAWAMSQENVENVRRGWEAFKAGMERGKPGAGFNTGTFTTMR